MPDSGTRPEFLDNAVRCEPSQHLVGSGLTEPKPRLDVPDSEDRVREQQVDGKVIPAATLKPGPVALPQVRQLFCPLHGICCPHGNAVEEELKPLRDLAALAYDQPCPNSPACDPVRVLVPVLEKMPAAGIALGDVIADSGYAHRDARAWAILPRNAGASLVQDLHPHDRGPHGTCRGAIAVVEYDYFGRSTRR